MIDGVTEQDAKENLWMQEREGITVGWGKLCNEERHIICIFHELFLGSQLELEEMSGTCSVDGAC